MKTKMMLFFGALCFFMLTGLKQSVAQDVPNVEVGIYLPSSGNYNEFYITFINQNTGERFEFHTDNNTAHTNVLGTIPAGLYNIDFQWDYWTTGFDFGVTSTDFYHYEAHHSAFTYYSAPVDALTILHIDEGY